MTKLTADESVAAPADLTGAWAAGKFTVALSLSAQQEAVPGVKTIRLIPPEGPTGYRAGK